MPRAGAAPAMLFEHLDDIKKAVDVWHVFVVLRTVAPARRRTYLGHCNPSGNAAPPLFMHDESGVNGIDHAPQDWGHGVSVSYVYCS